MGGGTVMNVAFIPVRGGSKSIPLKNIKTIEILYWDYREIDTCLI